MLATCSELLEKFRIGEWIVATLSQQMVHEYGSGFIEKKLGCVSQFAKASLGLASGEHA